MNSPIPITRCRACGNSELADVLSLGRQTLTGVFPKSKTQEVLAGPLDLVRCLPGGHETCGLLQMRHSYPQAAMYGDNYGYRSGLNSSMVLHLHETVARLLAMAQPAEGSLVCDIGCNDGTLLKAYPESLRRIGIDPVARKFLSFYPDAIQVATEFFSAATWETLAGKAKAAIITSIAMFYDLENPLQFVREVADCLAPDGLWHFEQSYMPLMVRRLAYDTICHEHVEYYALRQIVWLLKRAELKIVRLEPSDVNGGSLAVTAAHVSSVHPEASEQIDRLLGEERAAGYETMEPFRDFAKRVFEHRRRLLERIEQIRTSGRQLMGYGASTKGNVLLQFCGLGPDQLPFIAEVNEEKFGCYTPGTGIPIISEAAMHAMHPDVLLVLPWHFRSNLIEREKDFLAGGGRLLFPLPEIELYPA